jgi:radical SAM superfamily enzyme YgiQ (UPF0313 family)
MASSHINLINISIAKNFEQKVVYERNAVGVFLLISVLEKAGFNVNFKEYFLDHSCSYEEEVQRFTDLIDTSAPFISIGCHSIHLPFVVMAARDLKKRFPDKKIILGGIGPSGVARELLEKFSFIDGIIVGEAEQTIVEMVKKGTNGFNGIKGLVYRNKEKVLDNGLREPIADLDSLPLPAYHAMDFHQYEIPTIITSRGCPHGCPFCSLGSFWKREVRYRSIDNVIEELRLLVEKYGVKYVFFADPTFVTDRSRIIEFCQRLKEEDLQLKWECLVRVDCMDEELMRQMRDSGCEAVFYGLETGADARLKKVKKGITIKQSLEVIRASVKHFKTVEVSLMWGFPFETLDDFKQTLKIREYLELKLHCQVQLRWLEPYPATDFYRKYKNELFLPEKYSLIFNPKAVQKLIADGRDFYQYRGPVSSIQIPTDVTNVRFVIAASHMVAMCKKIIEQNPHIFCDYYRYKTPDLEKKIQLAKKYSLY